MADARERFHLNPLMNLVPLPGCETDLFAEHGQLTPEWAERWLHEDFEPFSTWARQGYEAEDAKTRDAFALLSCDVAMLTDLALFVQRTGRPHKVERADDGLWLDANLARIVAQVPSASGDGPYLGAAEVLAKFLAARLIARTERAERARSAA